MLVKRASGPSIEEIIAEAGITKERLFLSFQGQERTRRGHDAALRRTERPRLRRHFRARAGTFRRSLQAFLISLKLLAETMADLPGGHPGCLIASVCYQERLFDREVVALAAESVRSWNARFRGHIEQIAATHQPREPIDLDDLADMLSCVVDGGIIMSKTLNDPRRLERQILAFRALVKLMFSPAMPAAVRRPDAIAAE